MVPRWKLEVMADIIFQKFWNDREGVLAIANEMLDNCYENEHDNEVLDRKRDLEDKMELWNRKYNNLLDMRMAGEIEKDRYDEKREQILKEQQHLKKQLEIIGGETGLSDDIYMDKVEILKYGLEQNFNFSTRHIPEEVIDAFIKEIIVCQDGFIWKLNLTPDDELKMQVDGRTNNYTVTQTELSSDMTQQHRQLSLRESNIIYR